jgi:hypothetical protein
MSRDQNAGRNHNIGIDNSYFERVEEFRYLGTTLTNQNSEPEGKTPLRRPRRRWEDNVRVDLQEVGCGFEVWIGLAQNRDRWRALVSAVRNLRVPLNAGNFLTSCKPVSFSRRTLLHGVSTCRIPSNLSGSIRDVGLFRADSADCQKRFYKHIFVTSFLCSRFSFKNVCYSSARIFCVPMCYPKYTISI